MWEELQADGWLPHHKNLSHSSFTTCRRAQYARHNLKVNKNVVFKWNDYWDGNVTSLRSVRVFRNAFRSGAAFLQGKKWFCYGDEIRIVAATKNYAAATKRFVDRTKHFVVVTKYFCYLYFNKWFCWYNKTFYSVKVYEQLSFSTFVLCSIFRCLDKFSYLLLTHRCIFDAEKMFSC